MSNGIIPSDLLSARHTRELIAFVEERPFILAAGHLASAFSMARGSSLARTEETIRILLLFDILVVDAGQCGFWELNQPYEKIIVKRITDELIDLISGAGRERLVQWNAETKTIWVDSVRLPGTFAPFAMWMLDFGIATRRSIKDRFWELTPGVSAIVLNATRSSNGSTRRGAISLETLHRRQEENARDGLAAEEWVLAYEMRRLNDHPLKDQVRRISDQDVAAGFDIVSFSSAGILNHDLFIEVKSFEGQPRFYWSRNEVEVARRLEENYALYLVDRLGIDSPSYQPWIILDPASVLIDDAQPDWTVETETYRLTMLD